MKPTNSVFSGFGVSMFEQMSRLARETGALNLGQGFPDTDGPEALKRAAAEALTTSHNQYAPMLGLPELRRAIADHSSRVYGIAVDPETEVLVTAGATEALADSLMGLIEPGDEVVLIEPLFDTYLPMVRRAGGVPKFVRMAPPEEQGGSWELPRDALEAAFSDKTKLILLNSPHNPAAKVFGADDLRFIAALVERFDAYAVCDEVYEHIVFDQHTHIPLRTLPGMAERCLRIGSAGKTFSMTGWRLGYVTGPAALMKAVIKVHQYLTFATPSHLQAAVAHGLEHERAYMDGLAAEMQAKRDLLADGLTSAGFRVLPTDGTYFLNADIRSVGFVGTDVDFCMEITRDAGVAAIPLSILYADPEEAARPGSGAGHIVRFCFSKRDAVLRAASEKLAAHFGP